MENREIERKWLIDKLPEDILKSLPERECHLIEQAYLCISPTVRVRRDNGEFYLTYKGSRNWAENSDLSHSEYNLRLDRESYEHLKEKRDGIVISKKRYVIPIERKETNKFVSYNIELDIFDEPIAPLIIAEVEFLSEAQAMAFEAPSWFGEDVTADPRYKNAVMAVSG